MAAAPPALQLSEYLERLPGTTLRKLYQQPSAVFAIFRHRLLPETAKIFIHMLLYTPDPVLLSDLDLHIKPDPKAKREKDRALSTLKSLHIVQITAPNKEKPQEISLTTNFRSSLRLAIQGGGDHDSFGVPSAEPADAKIDTAYLDFVARKRWDDILHYVVNSVGMPVDKASSGGGGAGPKASVKELLLAGRLVESRGGGGVGITQQGFAFLLQESNAQVWTLLLRWLEATDYASPGASVDMLAFLLMLATLKLGRAYDTAALAEPRRNMLPTLVGFGLVYIPRDNARQYFPTRLATTLTSSASAVRSISSGFAAASAAGAFSAKPAANSTAKDAASGAAAAAAAAKDGIIIETNYRLYAYTSSPLQIAVLSLFTALKMRFPDMVTGRLTRESIRRAIGYGITSDQIVSYLHTHAHPQMHRASAASGKPVLPPTVVDQIRLWQMENERMSTTRGYLFKDFDRREDYDALVTYADEIGVLVWRGDRKQMFFASKHEQLATFLKSWKKKD